MERLPEENGTPPEYASTEQLRTWVQDVVSTASADTRSLQRVVKEAQKFQKYTTEVYLPIRDVFIKALQDSAAYPNTFSKELIGFASALFVAGYIEGSQR